MATLEVVMEATGRLGVAKRKETCIWGRLYRQVSLFIVARLSQLPTAEVVQ